MKKRHTLLLLLPLLMLLLSCDKDDDKPADPIDLLPPITQTGAGTFGALVDGKPFIADNPWFNCFYQLVDGEYYFGIQGRNDNHNPSAISLGAYLNEIVEGETYVLTEHEKGNYIAGGFFKLSPTNGVSSSTNAEYTGELTITKLDFTKYIVSGTFWFDLKHPVTGERVKIREGRFDTRFTQ